MKKILLYMFIAMLTLMLSVPYAVANSNSKPSASGGGVFSMIHEGGVVHRHFFGFSVSDPDYPKGNLNLVCMQGNDLCMIVQSLEIESLSFTDLSATFSGTARVKMQNQDWTYDWKFTAIVIDNDKKGSGNDQFEIELHNSGTHHMYGILQAGNIVIK